MRSKSTRVVCDSHLPDEAAPNDIPLYAFYRDGEWHFVDQDIWDDLTLQDEFAFTCEICLKSLDECEC